MVSSGKPGVPVALRDLAREHRADGAVDVADRHLDAHRLAALERRAGALDQRVVERAFEAVVLGLAAVGRDPGAGSRSARGAARDRGRAPSSARRRGAARARRPARSSRRRCGSPAGPCVAARPRPRTRRSRTTCSGLPVKRLRSSGSWVAMPIGQVLRWHLRIMMQPSATSARGGEAELVGAEQRGDHRRRGRCAARRRSARAMRPRSRFSTSVWWVSARPSSQGRPRA